MTVPQTAASFNYTNVRQKLAGASIVYRREPEHYLLSNSIGGSFWPTLYMLPRYWLPESISFNKFQLKKWCTFKPCEWLLVYTTVVDCLIDNLPGSSPLSGHRRVCWYGTGHYVIIRRYLPTVLAIGSVRLHPLSFFNPVAYLGFQKAGPPFLHPLSNPSLPIPSPFFPLP